MDKQLRSVDGAAARARYVAGLPVSLKQLALALEVGYEQVRTWRRLPGFPYEHRMIFPEDFRLWRQRRHGLLLRGAANRESPAEEPGRPDPCASARELVSQAGSALPPHLARMVARAAGAG